MNKHQRVRAAISGAEVDHVPAGFWLHFPPGMEAGEPALEAHLDFYRRTDVDLLKVMNEHLYRREQPVRSPADWATWTPMSISRSYMQKQVDLVKAVVDRVGGEVPVLATIHGTFICAFHASKRPEETIFGHNLATEHLRHTPESMVPALAAVSDTLIALSIACLEAGADGIYYGAQGGEAHRFDEATFNTYVKPFDLKVLEAIRDKTDMVVLHVCKDKTRMPLYSDYPVDAVNWAIHEGDYDLEAGRKLFDVALLGGLDDRSGVMVDGSPDEIGAEVRRIVSGVGKRSFILGSDCTLPTDIPLGNVRAAVDAARSI
jgi:uroporphyrinogen decarboxylase